MSEQENVWITGRTAERILGIGDHKIVKVAAAAGIRRREIPGLKPRYNRHDVEKLARESILGPELAEAK